MLPEEFSPEEKLGRYVTSKPNAAGRITHHVFFDKKQDALSVDRLSYASCDEAAKLGDEFAESIGRNFYGWGVVLAGDAEKDERSLLYQPILPENPYHSHIILPDISESGKYEHAHALAKKAHFKPKPQTDPSDCSSAEIENE